MRAAVSAGADLVEFDVQRTSDGHLIVVHDTTFARTTNVAHTFPGRAADSVGSFTLAQVRQLDAGRWFAARFAGTSVPTLSSLLRTMAATRTGLLLELKNPALHRGYETQVAHAPASSGYVSRHRVWVRSFDPASLERFHDIAPTVPVGLNTETGGAPKADQPWITSVNTTTGQLTDAAVDAATRGRLVVLAWRPRPTRTPRQKRRDSSTKASQGSSPTTPQWFAKSSTSTAAGQRRLPPLASNSCCTPGHPAAGRR